MLKKDGGFFRKITFVIVAIIFAYLLVGQVFLPNESKLSYHSYRNLNDGWELTRQDMTKSVISFPYESALSSDAEDGFEQVVFEREVPLDVSNRDVAAFWNEGNDVEVYVDKELRYSFDTSESRFFGRTSPYMYSIVQLNRSDAGKTIKIRIHARNLSIDNMYYGDKYSIVTLIVAPNLLEIILACFILLIGVVFLVISLLLLRSKIEIPQLEFFSLGAIVVAIWLLCNGSARQFIFNNVSTARDVAFFAFGMFPLPFLIAVEAVQGKRYVRLFFIAKLLSVVNFTLMFVLYITGISDFGFTQKLTVAVGVFDICVLYITIIIDIFNKEVKKYAYMAIGIFGLAFVGLCQIISFAVKGGVVSGLLIEAGVVWGTVFAAASAVKQTYKLVREKNEAILASKAKGEFLANMSHEIRTPINAVLGMDEMILRETNQDEIKTYALNLQRAGNNLLSIINDILDFSKIDSGKMDIVPVEYEIKNVLKDLITMVKPRIDDCKVKFEYKFDENIPSVLYGDDVRVTQVIMNILTNAAKYTKEGKIVFSVKCEKIDEKNCNLFVSVKDTGMGIKKEDLSKLFESFQRVDQKKNRNIEGTGLGLSITSRLLDLMDSKLEVASVYGEGSEFSFVIKQGIVSLEALGNFDDRINSEIANYVYEEKLYIPDKTILVVDDNKMNLMVFTNLLKNTGAKITTAMSGFEAIELVKKNKFDIIFMDHQMPEMDGIETLHKLKDMEDNLSCYAKIIVLTANALSGAKEMYLAEGFDDFLSKPVRGDDLEHCIQEHIL